MINRRMLFCLSVVLAVIFASCTNGSFDTADDSGGGSGTKVIEEHSHHPYLWDLQDDGSWKCSHCHEYIEGTTGAYWAELDANGQPKLIYTIKSPYTYTGDNAEVKNIIIRTKGGELTLNAANDTILHYGYVDTVSFAGDIYKGRAAIGTELSVTKGDVWLHDDLGEDVPLIVVPASATDHVSIEVDPYIYVEHIEVDSDVSTDIFVEGSVDRIDVISGGHTTIEVEGMVDMIAGVTLGTYPANGAGFVNDNNGTGTYGLPALVETSPNIYEIDDQLELRDVRYHVNHNTPGYNSFEGKTVKLTKDINLSGLWKSIGAWTSGMDGSTPSFEGVFKGTFDGQGHSINNLRISSSTHAYQALFGHTQGAVIQNLTVNGAVSAKQGAAGVVAYMEGGTLTNVTSNVAVSSERIAGGLVGWVNSNSAVTFTNCINAGIITGRSPSGNQGVGGIVGTLNSSAGTTFTNCQNVGMVDDTNGTHVGGILGLVNNSGTVTFTGCTNTATVYGGRNGVMAKIGGIMGCVTGNCDMTITNCSNTGAISSSAIVGGVLGFSQSTGLLTVSNCKSNGAIISTDSDYFAGGVIGTMRRGTVDANCEGGTATITATYAGRLIGRIWGGNFDTELDIGTGRVGSVNMRTVGCLQDAQSGRIIVKTGTLYGKPFSRNVTNKIKFKSGTKWTWDSSTTIDMTSDTTYSAPVGTYNWTTP